MLIIIIDIDGTLVSNVKGISKKLINALNLTFKKHNLILTSGRPYSGLNKIFSFLGRNCHAITLNGAAIYQESSSKLVINYYIQKKYTYKILDNIWNRENITISAYTKEKWYTKKIDYNVQKEAELLNIKPHKISLSDLLNKDILKITLVFSEEEEKKYCLSLLKRIQGISVYGSNPNYLEITTKNTNKSTSLTNLLNFLRIDVHNNIMISIGDGDNDVPVFRQSNISYAVGNASATAKLHSDHILSKMNGSAVLDLLEAINSIDTFGMNVNLTKPKYLDLINNNFEITRIGMPINRVHENKYLHQSVHIIAESKEGDVLCRLRPIDHPRYPGLWTSAWGFHLPSSYTIDRAIWQLINEIDIKLKVVNKLGSIHIEDKFENEICSFFSAIIKKNKLSFEKEGRKWITRNELVNFIQNNKTTSHLRFYAQLKNITAI